MKYGENNKLMSNNDKATILSNDNEMIMKIIMKSNEKKIMASMAIIMSIWHQWRNAC